MKLFYERPNDYYSPEGELLKYYLNESVEIIEYQFGDGYAKCNPHMVIKHIEYLIRISKSLNVR